MLNYFPGRNLSQALNAIRGKNDSVPIVFLESRGELTEIYSPPDCSDWSRFPAFSRNPSGRYLPVARSASFADIRQVINTEAGKIRGNHTLWNMAYWMPRGVACLVLLMSNVRHEARNAFTTRKQKNGWPDGRSL